MVFRADNAWHFLVSGWGDPEVLIKPGWSWIAVPLLDGVVSCIVQIFFAWRIYKISGTIWIPIPILIVALTQVRHLAPDRPCESPNQWLLSLGHLRMH